MYCKLHLLQEVMKRILSDRYKASINYHLTCSTIRNAVIYYFIYNGSSSFGFNAFIFHYVLFCYQYHPYHHYYNITYFHLFDRRKNDLRKLILYSFLTNIQRYHDINWSTIILNILFISSTMLYQKWVKLSN